MLNTNNTFQSRIYDMNTSPKTTKISRDWIYLKLMF